VIPARDYAGAEDRGEIISVVHSHPNNNVEPSDADLEACMASGLPWWIVSWPGGMWHRIDPRSAPDVLAGHAFKWGERDCAAIVAEWYRREAGIELPPFPRESITSFSCMAFVAYVEHAGFEFIPLESDRKAGDVVLMQLRGDGPDHLGVIDDSGRLVHHLAGRLSSLDAYVGLWLSATTAVLRRMI
jgi:cell wall-associated NlpC family hydrolase